MHLKSNVVPLQTQDTFQQLQTVTTESLPAGPLLYGAYAAVWIVLILYLFVLTRRLTRVERELKDVSARAAKRS